jgi:DNA-binding Xre family transcriptional regulator
MRIGANNIYIGILLNKFMMDNHISNQELAKKIGRIPLSVNQYRRKDTMQTGVLAEICHATQHNFFSDMAYKLPQHFTTSYPKDDALITEKDALIAQLKEENKVLKIQNDLLLQIQRGKI